MPRKFDSLKSDHPGVGTICHLCGKPLETGQFPSLIADAPANDEELAKKEAGKDYNATALIVHWNCVPLNQRC